MTTSTVQRTCIVRSLDHPQLELRYVLPPNIAVRNAFAQYGRKDFNTWDYDTRYTAAAQLPNGSWRYGAFYEANPLQNGEGESNEEF